MQEILGLIADINPVEIASHIADGTLEEWCEALRQALTVMVWDKDEIKRLNELKNNLEV